MQLIDFFRIAKALRSYTKNSDSERSIKKEFAEHIGISYMHLCRIVNRKVNPNPQTCQRIIQETGGLVTMTDLVREVQEKDNANCNSFRLFSESEIALMKHLVGVNNHDRYTIV